MATVRRDDAEALLSRAGASLSSSLDVDVTLRAVARLAVPSLADWCAAYLLEGDHVRRVEVAHADETLARAAQDAARRAPIRLDDPRHPVARVLRTGRPEVATHLEETRLDEMLSDPGTLRFALGLGLRSILVVPLLARGRVLGALALATTKEAGRRLGEDDLPLATSLAARAALSVDNALLYAEANAARERAERLQAVAASLGLLESSEAVARHVLDEALAALGAYAGGVGVLAPDGRRLDMIHARGYPPEKMALIRRIPLTEEHPPSLACLRGEPLWIESEEAYRLLFPAAASVAATHGTRAAVALPLQAGGRSVGALYLSFREPRAFPSEERAFVAALAHQCAQALERARLYDAEREARAAAERSEARLRAIVEHAPAAVFLKDLDGRYALWNRRTAEILGERDLTGRTDADLLPPHEARALRGNDAAVLEAGEAREVEETLDAPSGRRTFLSVKFPVHTPDGALAGVGGISTDITRRKAAEEELRLFRSIYENSHDAVAIIDAEGRYLMQNAAHRALLGYDDAALAGRTPAIHLGKEAFAGIARALERDGALRGEYLCRTRDGRTLDVDLSAFTLRDGGRVVCHVGIKRDVSERKRMEERLRRGVAELQAMYALSEALARAPTLEAVYDAAFGALRGSLRAERASILLFDDEGVMRFQAWRGLSAAYRAAVEGHSPWPADARDPQPVLVPDVEADESLAAYGDLFRAEGVRALAFIPLVDQGRLIGKFMLYDGAPRAFAQDETRLAAAIADALAGAIVRKRADDALRRSEQWLRAIFDTLDSAVLVVHHPGRFILNANRAAARMFGYAPEEMRGLHMRALHVDDAHHEEFDRRVEEPFARGETAHVELRMRRRDGTTFPAEHAASLLRSPSGDVMGALSVIEDVTARKVAEQELEAARRQIALTEKLSALGTLVSGVAHEVRTPLAYVTNNLFLVRQRLDRLEAGADVAAIRREVLAHSDEALEGVDRINRIVGELRRFTRLKTGERERHRLDEVVADAVALFRSTHRGRVLVEAKLDRVPPLALDKVQLQQVVLNLLENGADAMATRGGALRVAVRPWERGAEIVVEDRGAGIPPDVQPRMFDPLFTTKAEGTGLGLSITKRIVEEHAGDIKFETRPGEGTTFFVRLPGP